MATKNPSPKSEKRQKVLTKKTNVKTEYQLSRDAQKRKKKGAGSPALNIG